MRRGLRPQNHGNRNPVSTDPRRTAYNNIADDFDGLVNAYDTSVRLAVVDRLVGGLSAQRVLDVGCGSGRFSALARGHWPNVTSLDIAPRLVAQATRRAGSRGVVGDACRLPFASSAFDLVISSECLEHTPNPGLAAAELCRVLAPGGHLCLTVPNRVWHPLVLVANASGIRPFHGFENWPSWDDVRLWVEDQGLRVLEQHGFHAFPFQWRGAHPLLRALDRHAGHRAWGRYMINTALLARKPS